MKIMPNKSTQQITVGIDIGSSKICCAIGQVSIENNKIKLLGLATTRSRGIKRGVITDRDKLIETIEKVLTDAEIMGNIKITSSYLSITGEHIRSINTQAAIALNRVNGTAGNVTANVGNVASGTNVLAADPDKRTLMQKLFQN